ncbi:MAG: DciA family protein [Pseudomonadota bacterium]
MAQRRATTKGFARTSSLLTQRIRKASESRGFAQSRILTHWEEVAGPEMAAVTRPVDVSYGRQGFGATLTILTTGAHAPMIEMQKEQLRARVNAIYGYNAISRVRITQTSPVGFSEGRVDFEHRKTDQGKPEPSAKVQAAAEKVASKIDNDDLRNALERLAQNVLSRTNN